MVAVVRLKACVVALALLTVALVTTQMALQRPYDSGTQLFASVSHSNDGQLQWVAVRRTAADPQRTPSASPQLAATAVAKPHGACKRVTAACGASAAFPEGRFSTAPNRRVTATAVTSDSTLWFGDSAKNDVLSFLTTCDLRSDAYTGMTGRLVVAANMTLFVERVVNANPLTVPSWDLETQGGAYVLVDMARAFDSNLAVTREDYRALPDHSDVASMTLLPPQMQEELNQRREGDAHVPTSASDDTVVLPLRRSVLKGIPVGGDTATVQFRISPQPGTNRNRVQDAIEFVAGRSELRLVVCDVPDECPDDDDKTEPGLCGCGRSDRDSDADGTPDCLDACPADGHKTAPGRCGCHISDDDEDGDGSICDDACPLDGSKITAGVCGCGFQDAAGCPVCHLWGLVTMTFNVGGGLLRLADGQALRDPLVDVRFSVQYVVPTANGTGSRRVAGAYYDGVAAADVVDAAADTRTTIALECVSQRSASTVDVGVQPTPADMLSGSRGVQRHIFRARAYCERGGPVTWRTASNVAELDGLVGSFVCDPREQFIPPGWKGKLRQHSRDAYQFMYDNGEWFLHVGDTGYRYVIDSEPEWRQYLDQAVADVRATKIRVWFAGGRHDVDNLLTPDMSSLNLASWQTIDARLMHALQRYPWLQFQLIVFGEDWFRVTQAALEDPMSALIPAYAQARWSAFPTVQWCVINDVVRHAHVDVVATAMAAREPWGSLLTSHQKRFTGYKFGRAPWSNIVTLQTQDELWGSRARHWRRYHQPVVMEEDRYEMNKLAGVVDDSIAWYREYMWSNIVSGAHPTYGGIKSWEAFSGCCSGVRGYADVVAGGHMPGAARDFQHIHAFFRETGLTMVGMVPEPSICTTTPASDDKDPRATGLICALAADGATVIAYANNTSPPAMTFTLRSPQVRGSGLSAGTWQQQCFNVRDGAFSLPKQVTVAAGSDSGHSVVTLTCAQHGDRVVVLRWKGA